MLCTLVSTIGGALVSGTPRLTYVGLVSTQTTVESIDATTLVGSVDATLVDTGPANKDAMGAGNTLLGTSGGAKHCWA